MKILYSCLSKSWGGMEMYTLASALQLKNKNLNVSLLCYPDSELFNEAIRQKLNVITSTGDKYFHPIEIIKLIKHLKKNKFDIIHSHASSDLWLIVPALRTAKIQTPLFFTKHVGSFINKKDILHNYLYNRVNIAFAISSVIKNNLLETTSLNESKIKILHNGVDTKFFDPALVNPKEVRKEFNIYGSDIVIGMIARITWGKGYEELLKAAGSLVNEYKNLKFLLVGKASRGEEDYAEKIQNLSGQLGLKDKVIFTGYRKDTRNLISAMDIFAFPSHSEAFGIALIEAMSMAKPSVCSNSDGILDIAVEGKTSLLFKRKDENDLKEKLKILIDSEQMRTKLGKAARERAIKKFDFNKITEKTIGFYNLFS